VTSSAEALVTGTRIDPADALRLAVEASPTGVLVVNATGTIVLVNRELERQFGYTRDELVGRGVETLVPEPLRAEHAIFRAALEARPRARTMGRTRDVYGVRKDGSRIAVEVELQPIPTDAGTAVVASVMDVTDQRRSEVSRRAVVEDQLAFERFVTDLSVEFINLPFEQIDAAIVAGLGQSCERLGFDRSAFARVVGDGEFAFPLAWARPGVSVAGENALAADRFPWSRERVLAGQVVAFSTPEDIPSEMDRASYRAIESKSAVVLPLSVGGQVGGVVRFGMVTEHRTWTPDILRRLTILAGVFGQVLARQQREEAIQAASAEAERLKEQIQVENVFLRREARHLQGPPRIIGHSAAIKRVLEQIQQVAATDATVLLLGETGTGKELLATQIHELGPRHTRAMVRVNCGAIPTTLIESELFGREKGAFTGAAARQVGRFEMADQSTIFLDEIGDLPADVQVKLLRVLEEKQVERLGSPRPITVDTRIIAATHRNLEQRIAQRAFREDLYYRLNVFPIHVPPLRERAEDIPLLAWRFVEEFSNAFNKRIDSIDPETLLAMQRYSWPGNIRELRNIIERAMIVATTRRLTVQLPQASPAATKRSPRLLDVETEHIRSVLESTGWRVRGAGGAADRLGLKPTTLETRMTKLGLKRPGR
jgi:PAS domain S-box-containing protein